MPQPVGLVLTRGSIAASADTIAAELAPPVGPLADSCAEHAARVLLEVRHFVQQDMAEILSLAARALHSSQVAAFLPRFCRARRASAASAPGAARFGGRPAGRT